MNVSIYSHWSKLGKSVFSLPAWVDCLFFHPMFNSISALLKGYNKWQQQNYSHPSRQRGSASCLSCPPPAQTKEKENKEDTEDISWKDQWKEILLMFVQLLYSPDHHFCFLVDLVEFFLTLAHLTCSLCTWWVLYGAEPKCRWSYRWILWCRLCDTASSETAAATSWHIWSEINSNCRPPLPSFQRALFYHHENCWMWLVERALYRKWRLFFSHHNVGCPP